MDLKFSIHNFFNVLITNPPEGIGSFLEREFQYFKVDKLDRINLEIKFVDRIEIPDKSVCLLRDFIYENGTFYFNFSGSTLCVPIKDICKENIVVLSEKRTPVWMIFYVIEKILHIKILEKDFCFFHAAGMIENGKTAVYSSLQSGGKTGWVFRGLRNKAGFFGDDLILVNRSGHVFSYPRRINLNKYHGTSYRRFLESLPISIYIKNRVFVMFLCLLRNLLQFHGAVKRRIDEVIESKNTFRVNVNQIFPDVEIINNKKVDKLIIALKTYTRQQTFEKWELKRNINFMLHNTSNERLAHAEKYMRAFFAYGDDHSFTVRKYIAELMKKEVNTVSRILKKCEVETIIVQH